MRILLIAGHGAGDPGACGNGYQEATLVRALAPKVKEKLSGYATVDIFDMNKNMYKFLKSGGQFNFSSYNYIFELHFNASGGGAHGTEILVHTNQNGISVEQKIVDNIATLGYRNRGVKRRSDLQNMNKIFRLGKDYALLETCFIDNASDMAKYNVDKVATAIADGIISGFKLGKTTAEIKTEAIKELTTVNDIVWELGNIGIITDKNLWLKKLNEDTNSYWLARKMVNYLRGFKY